MKTIRIFSNIFLILSFLSASSCMTRLKVHVSVANRDKVKEEAEKNIKIALPRLFNRFQYQADNANNLNDSYIDLLSKSIKPLIKDSIVEYEIKLSQEKLNEIERGLKIARDLYEDQEYLSSFEELVGAENSLLSYYDDRINFFSINKRLINSLDPSKKANYDEGLYKLLKQRKEREYKVSLDTERLRFNLLGDPLTYYVAKERDRNDDFWKAKYNETKVSTFMGNADVAIILRKNPDTVKTTRSGDYNNNFTIKGVRLDAEDVVQASFRTLSQSINLFASIQAPTMTLNSQDKNVSDLVLDSDLSTTLGNIETNKATLETKEMFLDEMRDLLISKLILEDTASKEGEEYKSSLANIQEFWKELKTKLEVKKSNPFLENDESDD